MLLQQNSWSCSITALANLLDVPVAEIIRQIGHDGSEVLWPYMPEPQCRRGFHPRELLEVALYYNTHFVAFEADPQIGHTVESAVSIYPDARDRFYEKLTDYDGLLYGQAGDTRHWWTVKNSEIWCPTTGANLSINSFLMQYEPLCFYALF